MADPPKMTPPVDDDGEDPLLKALPPATDYLTYLTILEYQLTRERLPLLHRVLQDEKLTSNIGWDLVHLLLPLLPESEECLRDVARLGNPREVILKVTECLEEIGVEDGPVEDDDEGDEDEHDNEVEEQEEEEEERGDKGDHEEKKEGEGWTALSARARQFICLLSLLSVLHVRIRTKRPSRFLATSLQAILPAYSKVVSPATTTATVEFVRALSGRKRPSLPPRLSSRDVPSISSPSTDDSAPDPEGQGDDGPVPEDSALQVRLLQSFLTHVLEEYAGSSCGGSVSGLAWTGRLQEKWGSAKLVPGRKSETQKFMEENDLKERDLIVGQILALCRDVHLSSYDLLETLVKPPLPDDDDEEELEETGGLPSDPSKIPFSRPGCLYLLTARIFSTVIFQSTTTSTSSPIPTIPIFPTHSLLLASFLGPTSISTIGTEPPATIDALLMLGFLALHNDAIGTPESHDHFTQYLQLLSALSASTPDARQRYDAHRLASAVLHSHSSPLIRLEFIRDTLEHVPWENLKASAVGWLKNEILAAASDDDNNNNNNTATPNGKAENPETEQESPSSSPFIHPQTFKSLVPLLYPPLYPTLIEPPLPISWQSLQQNLNFYLATLNFTYLILSNRKLSECLNVADTFNSGSDDIRKKYLDVMMEATENFGGFLRGEWGDGKLVDDREVGRALGEVELVRDGVERVLASLQ